MTEEEVTKGMTACAPSYPPHLCLLTCPCTTASQHWVMFLRVVLGRTGAGARAGAGLPS